MSVRVRAIVVGAMTTLVAALGASSQVRYAPKFTAETSLFHELTWRNIGPFRGGRTTAAAGIASQPNVFYIGTAEGGAWKTTDTGRSWRPIFDDQSVGSIGAIAVAQASPDTVYVGSGSESSAFGAVPGDGAYRSDDAGQTWVHLGLAESQYIPAIIVDPRNPNRLFVAARGNPFGASQERGVFRSVDGGRTFDHVLFQGDETGAVGLAFDPQDPTVVYAVLRQSRWDPSRAAHVGGSGTGLYKSSDNGDTWRESGTGLPTFASDGLTGLVLAVAPANRQRLLVAVAAERRGGLYASSDAGETWTAVGSTPTTVDIAGGAGLAVDPNDSDVVYVTGAAAWRSTDGGATFALWRSDPDRGRFRDMWINPSDSRVAVLTGDRGATVTVNGGTSWSSSLNQPTGGIAHVAADMAFPYRVCGSDPAGAAACAPSRGDPGLVAPDDWRPVGVARGGFVAPDPSNADVVFTGTVGRYDRRTGQVQKVGPPQAFEMGSGNRAPLVFAPTDDRVLYFASNVLWKTTTAGQAWTTISPDLTPGGAITSVAPSPVDGRVIWTGGDVGRGHVTTDAGVTWTEVTPPAFAAQATVARLEASHFDASTAYAAVNRGSGDDAGPRLWRTRSGGAEWTDITRGLPAGREVNAVCEDPFRRGLLFAATDRSVFLSFDDGDTWQSLRLNLPPTAVRDLAIKGADLIAATSGRGVWILEDITTLRQITADIVRADMFLFRPPTVWRMQSRSGLASVPPAKEPTVPTPP